MSWIQQNPIENPDSANDWAVWHPWMRSISSRIANSLESVPTFETLEQKLLYLMWLEIDRISWWYSIEKLHDDHFVIRLSNVYWISESGIPKTLKWIWTNEAETVKDLYEEMNKYEFLIFAPASDLEMIFRKEKDWMVFRIKKEEFENRKKLLIPLWDLKIEHCEIWWRPWYRVSIPDTVVFDHKEQSYICRLWIWFTLDEAICDLNRQLAFNRDWIWKLKTGKKWLYVAEQYWYELFDEVSQDWLRWWFELIWNFNEDGVLINS